LEIKDSETKVVVDTALLFLCVEHAEAKREEKSAAEANHPLLGGRGGAPGGAPLSPNPSSSTTTPTPMVVVEEKEVEKKSASGAVRAIGAVGGAVLGAITSVIPGMGGSKRNEDKNETPPERKHRDSEAPLPSFIANRDLG
jgi:hypothetical protein